MNRRRKSRFGGKPYLLKGTVFTEVGFRGKVVVVVAAVAVGIRVVDFDVKAFK